jgi:polyhydroxyalkanoate synthase
MIKLADKLVEKASPSRLDPMGLGRAYWNFWRNTLKQPQALFAKNLELAMDQARLIDYGLKKITRQPTEVVAEPARGDRRFNGADWNENLLFDLIKQSYLLTASHVSEVVGKAGLEEHEQHKLDFFTQQMLDAISPSNFALTNPEVLQATADSKGQNLVNGMKNLAADLKAGGGKLKISMVDKGAFEVGVNTATSPGKVVYQNEMMQLIQYSPSTDNVYRRPLLIFPPWINKFYILDLSEKNSFIRWMVDQGYTVFIVSWVNPDRRLSQKSFEDYMNEGVFEAISAVEAATGESEINTIGYCIGGTLLACALSQMAITGDERVRSATFFTTQVDFSEAGDLKVFIDEPQLDQLEKKMAKKGYLDSEDMAMTFNMLRSNDLIWSFVVNNYLMGRKPAAFDLLYWNNDSTRMPLEMHRYYLREMYLKNRLSQPGGVTLNGIPVHLSEIKIPIYIQSARDDHIAPYPSVYKATQIYGGPVTFMLAGSGHIAGVVNPPSANKYFHYTNDELPANVEDWIEGADYHEGSWWPHWDRWLAPLSGDMVVARNPGDGQLAAIEDAPGSYVAMK